MKNSAAQNYPLILFDFVTMKSNHMSYLPFMYIHDSRNVSASALINH